LPENTLLNVNIPPLPTDELLGITVTKQGKAFYDEKFDKRVDPRSRTYYWMSGERMTQEEEEGSDEKLVQDGYVSVTPVQYDLTHYKFLNSLKDWSIFKNNRLNLKKVS
jgi:5'-nucleotidase